MLRKDCVLNVDVMNQYTKMKFVLQSVDKNSISSQTQILLLCNTAFKEHPQNHDNIR